MTQITIKITHKWKPRRCEPVTHVPWWILVNWQKVHTQGFFIFFFNTSSVCLRHTCSKPAVCSYFILFSRVVELKCFDTSKHMCMMVSRSIKQHLLMQMWTIMSKTRGPLKCDDTFMTRLCPVIAFYLSINTNKNNLGTYIRLSWSCAVPRWHFIDRGMAYLSFVLPSPALICHSFKFRIHKTETLNTPKVQLKVTMM